MADGPGAPASGPDMMGPDMMGPGVIRPDVIRPEMTTRVTRGVLRLFIDQGFAPITEFPLPNGRRADIVGLDRKGRIAIAEVKSSREDFVADAKWAEYLEFCDFFYFAVSEDFPREILPDQCGLIVADAYGGAVLRGDPERKIAAARRKAVTLRFARRAAMRALDVAAGA